MYTVDRIEQDIVILENRNTKKTFNINKNNLPDNIKEGDILNKINNEYFIDIKETKNKKSSIKDRFNKLKKK